ncbi:MAG: DUF1653 domain-containing protein [bacterium]|nr:DUF1653 domain-containing protein [bacterium]
MIEPGTYKHYKGGIYEVLFEAEQTETREMLVIYRGQDGRFWARPKTMFLEKVNGRPRFKKTVEKKDAF